VFFAFLPMCCLASLAAFQNKWKIGTCEWMVLESLGGPHSCAVNDQQLDLLRGRSSSPSSSCFSRSLSSSLPFSSTSTTSSAVWLDS
jgi:hypothetical protein